MIFWKDTHTRVKNKFLSNYIVFINGRLQAFGEEFLKLLGSLSLQCAVNRFILEYRDLLANGCSSEALQVGTSTEDTGFLYLYVCM